MFKFRGGLSGRERDGSDFIPHDRYCQHRGGSLLQNLKKTRRTNFPNRARPVEEPDPQLDIELTAFSSLSSVNGRENHEEVSIHYKNSRNSKEKIEEQSLIGGEDDYVRSVWSSWDSISRFFSSAAGILNCQRGARKLAQPTNFNRPENVKEYEYRRLGEDSLHSDLPFHVCLEELEMAGIEVPGLPDPEARMRAERAAGLAACNSYLKGHKGRHYLLINHLPDIGWRGNRLWALVCDSRVRAERILTVTPLPPNSPIKHLPSGTSTNALIQVFRALQHPYIVPVLDLDIVRVTSEEEVAGELTFAIVLSPVTSRGSLRDLIHKVQWAENWTLKYSSESSGLKEGHAQRLSCQILEALIELRGRGVPAGIGAHLHPGNVLVQHGIARFAGLDNVLFRHRPRPLPYILSLLNSYPDALDSVAFAYMLFSMCSGYEVVTAKLTTQNWNDIRDYHHVFNVLEFILKNPERRFPSLQEIAQLDFFRVVDLRELRPLPMPFTIAGQPSLPTVQNLLEHIFSINKWSQRKKSRSTSDLTQSTSTIKAEEITTEDTITPTNENVLPILERQYSISTPSLRQASVSDEVEILEEKPMSDYRVVEVQSESEESSQVSIYSTPPSSFATSTPPRIPSKYLYNGDSRANSTSTTKGEFYDSLTESSL